MSVYPFTTDVAFVSPLAHFRRHDITLAGGKGANLGELSWAGFDVPPGFIITTAVYDLLFQGNELHTRFTALLDTLRPDDPDSVRTVSQQMQDLFQQVSIPGQVMNEILEAYRSLHHEAVAVRSSATAEDLAEAAFAGQQDTFLNVIGEKDLIKAVRACWGSLWTERAILYRARQKVEQTSVKLAVIVQAMVPAQVAGVMFTANPVSGSREELIIDANLGLGESVVSGSVTPDHVVVAKHSLRIKEQRIGRREVILRAREGGGTEQVPVTQEMMKPALSSSQAIRKLSQAGIQIERHYGSPQDIEWAWVQEGSNLGRFLILQARPMTALSEPIKISGPMRSVIPMLAEMWPTRPYPLDMTTFTGTIERAIGNLLVAMMGKSAPSPDESFLEEDGVAVQFKPPQVHPSPAMLITPWITLWRTRRNDLSQWESDPGLQEFINRARVIERSNIQSLSWKQNVALLNEALELIPGVMKVRERYLPQTILGLAGLWLLLVLIHQTDRFGVLTSGVKTKTTETNQALEELAAQIRADPVLQDLFAHMNVEELSAKLKTFQTGQALWKQFEEFLDRYGHRETSLTISQPAWKDDPANVLAILKVLAETERAQPESYRAWQQAQGALLAHSILGTWFLRALFLNSLTRARFLFQIREDTHFYATLVQPVIRRIALELGRRLVEAGALDRQEDVFHLRWNELEALGEPWPPPLQALEQLRALATRRKAKRESLRDRPMFDPRLLSMTLQAQSGEDVLLRGTSGSPGIASGPVKIIHDVSEFGRLRVGDVLVTPVTNPAWTPLFQRAVAVVVDTGGSASHAAIVAREYGVPAVMGTMNGTKELKDGQQVKVDGSRGLVWKVEEKK